MNKATRRLIKGCLEVRTIRHSRCGIGEYFIPIDSIGYVIGTRDDDWLVHWPFAELRYKGDNRTSSHPKADLAATGRRSLM
jgi:hypothetical protein